MQAERGGWLRRGLTRRYQCRHSRRRRCLAKRLQAGLREWLARWRMVS